MTLRLTEYKLIFRSYVDCLGMFLVPAKQNGGDGGSGGEGGRTMPCGTYGL